MARRVEADDPRGWWRRFLVLSLTVPSAASALGVDGGVIFQILAVEDLGLSPAAIGTALGLGVVSIPLQLWAARMSLTVARRNLLWFLGLSALGCLVLAGLVLMTEPGDAAGMAALAITVLAEIAVSVLFATSWQPLLSMALTTRARQSLNSRGRAAGGGVLVLLLLAFGGGSTVVRVGILCGIAAAAVGTLLLLRRLPVPTTTRPGEDDTAAVSKVPRAAVPLLALAGFGAASAWPLFPVYAAEVFWPTVDLGIVGAIGTGGALAVAALWRSTDGSLLPRARLAAGLLVLSALAFALLPAASASGAPDVLALGAFGVSVAARSVLLMTMLELVHRTVSAHTSVRVLTTLDVVASTSLQASLFIGGLVITWSSRSTWGPLDPYQLYTLVMAVGVAGALTWVHGTSAGSSATG